VTVIRVAVVDDHPVVRDGTAALLDLEPDLEVVVTAGSLPELAERLATAPAKGVDVIVLDIRLGQASGLDLLPQLAAEGSGAPATVVLSAYDYPQYVEAAHRLGAAGYVLKTAPTAELIEAIRRAAAGGLSFSVRPSATVRALSERERDVVRLVIDGRSNDEIGGQLGIGGKTVETHLRRLFERHGLASRTELATRAIREGWLDVPA
jgi:DNA-binding NarL/FixJ family response regulator